MSDFIFILIIFLAVAGWSVGTMILWLESRRFKSKRDKSKDLIVIRRDE